jgi:hypothetical protein
MAAQWEKRRRKKKVVLLRVNLCLKGKGRPITGYKGPEGKQRYSSVC